MRNRQTISPDTVNSILIFIGPYPDDAIGENFIKLPFLRGLADAFPDAHITWMHGDKPNMFGNVLEPVARSLIGEFLPASTLNASWGNALKPFRLMVDRHFDLIIDTQKNPMYAMTLRRISHGTLISPAWRYFFSGKKPGKNANKPRSLAEKLLALLILASGSDEKPDHLAHLPAEFGMAAKTILPDGPTYIGLAPGAGNQGRGKCWPLENYIVIARQLIAAGQVPVFFLGPLEQDWRNDIAQQVPDAVFSPLEHPMGHNATIGGPSLTVALGARLSVSVANCSGTGHMLAAGGSKMVSLFGPTDPEKFAPYTPHLAAIRAQSFGSEKIDAIPVQVVYDTVQRQLMSDQSVETRGNDGGCNQGE